jgi:predicted RNA binding protein YcfA (HicA-like mRNA interferase family)
MQDLTPDASHRTPQARNLDFSLLLNPAAFRCTSGVIPSVVSLFVETELARLRTARRSVHPKTMHALLAKAGFERRYGKGDHWVYTHPLRRYPLTIDPRNPLLPAYVSRAIQAIEEVLTADEDDRTSD